MKVTCSKCGNEFDTDREAAKEHMNTKRCPQCGEEAEIEKTEDTTIEGDGVEIHIHIHH